MTTAQQEATKDETLNVLSLFSGIGGLELGLERAGMTVVGQVEIDEYCRRVLAKHWPDVPRHDDVRTAADWWLSRERPRVDVICGGFPCQDISSAGRRAGILDGDRSGLWAHMAETVRRIRPRYMLVENVPRVLVRGRDGAIPAEIVAADLAALGYDLRWDCLPAASFGAPHLRDRWFGIAYADCGQLRDEPVAESGRVGAAITGDDGPARPLADASHGDESDESQSCDAAKFSVRAVTAGRRGAGGRDGATTIREPGRPASLSASATSAADRTGQPHVQGRSPLTERAGFRAPDRSGWWRTEPDVGRVVDGFPTQLDRDRQRARVHALGNSVVPQVAEYVGQLIVEHATGVAA